MTPRQRLTVLAICALAISFAYFWMMGSVGVLEPDEPRYAAIGKAMAQTGDWITPKLWGSPWFEKPALLYWMTGTGFRLGLGNDVAGRLPVTVLSLLFLVSWFALVKEEFGFEVATVATGTLATCAGWFVYSSLCLTDLPLAAFFSMGVLFTLRILRRGGANTSDWIGLGLSIGIAALAKGLVPLVLSAPLLWFLKDYWRHWWISLLCLIMVAAPWYYLVIHVNGAAFLRVFFWQQQFSRLYSNSLQHVKPFYFYLPALLGVLFPWTPLLASLRIPDIREDRRLQCLASVFVFGFLFVSASLNKLPGYVLPLVPSLLALVSVSAVRRGLHRNRAMLVACGILVALAPLAGRLTPYLLTSRAISLRALVIELLPITLGLLILFVTPILVAVFADRKLAAPLLFLSLAVAIVEVKTSVYPILDEQASPRGFWREIQSESDNVCDAGLHRSWAYGLAFYRGEPIPICDRVPKPLHLTQYRSQRATVVRVH